MAFPWLAVATLGAAGIGAASSAVGAKQQNEAQEKEAQRNRDFQERMSSTAHEREVADLRKAGLNPILSSKYGGSSTPPGGMAQYHNVAEQAVSGARGINDAILQRQQMKVLKSQEDLNVANTAKTLSESKYTDTRTLGETYRNIVSAAEAGYIGSNFGKFMLPVKDVLGAVGQGSSALRNLGHTFAPRY